MEKNEEKTWGTILVVAIILLVILGLFSGPISRLDWGLITEITYRPPIGLL